MTPPDRDPAVRFVGVRELSRRTTWTLARAEAGDQVVVTRRHRPIAVIFSVRLAEDFLLLHTRAMIGLRDRGRAERRAGESVPLDRVNPYEVTFSTEATDAFQALARGDRARIGRELKMLARRASRRRGDEGIAPPPASESYGVELRNASDGEVAIVRAGYQRVVCDLDDVDRVIHVLAIVNRFDLRRAAVKRTA